VVGKATKVKITLTLWRQAGFGDFRKKMPKRTWLCVGISPGMLYRPGKSLKRSGKSSSLHSKKKIFA